MWFFILNPYRRVAFFRTLTFYLHQQLHFQNLTIWWSAYYQYLSSPYWILPLEAGYSYHLHWPNIFLPSSSSILKFALPHIKKIWLFNILNRTSIPLAYRAFGLDLAQARVNRAVSPAAVEGFHSSVELTFFYFVDCGHFSPVHSYTVPSFGKMVFELLSWGIKPIFPRPCDILCRRLCAKNFRYRILSFFLWWKFSVYWGSLSFGDISWIGDRVWV